MLEALQLVAARLREHEIDFLLGGSALLRALGHDVEVRDVDLMLRTEDRERFEAACAEWWVATTTEPGPVLTSDWKATLDVDGVEVEGLGGLAIAGGAKLPFRGEGEWHGVPLAAPEVWYEAYRVYNPAKAALLKSRSPDPARRTRRGS